MPPDPGSIFGSLLRGCISDVYLKGDRKDYVESAVFLSLGVCSSIATTYALSLAGFFV
ncbi:MAG: hypothetical protein HY297_06030 [Thaumarchaeota archaeon]|nr:hypothetical protein [Nitrososphaerota archaeon]